MSEGTIAELFELAIAAEKAGQSFYFELAEKFYRPDRGVEFWKAMHEDERRHVQELESIRLSVTQDQLLAPADLRIIQKMKEVVDFFTAKDLVKAVATVNDAYMLALRFERSEVNRVFILLARQFIPLKERRNFVVAQITVHVKKFLDFRKTIELGPPVFKVGRKYRCKFCGNEGMIAKAGSTLVCCGEYMDPVS